MSTQVVRSDTIDLLVSALMVLGLSPDPAKPLPTGEQCVTHIADGVGRELAEANLDAVSLSEGSNPPETVYRWRPVMEVALRYALSPATAVQVEAARRYLIRNCAAHPGWEQSQARQIVARLGRELEARPAAAMAARESRRLPRHRRLRSRVDAGRRVPGAAVEG